MKHVLLAGGLALALGTAACDANEGGEATPTLDTAGSGAPLNPGGVGPNESQQEIDASP